MLIETWGWVWVLSGVLIIFWLAGIGAGSKHEYSWAGAIVGAIPILGLAVSMIAIIGWVLVK